MYDPIPLPAMYIDFAMC